MLLRRLLGAFACFAAVVFAPQADATEAGSTNEDTIEILQRVPVTDLRLADVRLESPNQLLLAAIRDGGVRIRLDDDAPHIIERHIASRSGGDIGAMATSIASSDAFIVTAPPMGAVVWSRRGEEELYEKLDFDSVLDLDISGSLLAVMAARRDGRNGRFAPDGSVVSIGRLDHALDDLRPLYISISGVGAPSVAFCGPMRIGHVRFLHDGSLVVAPGVEPGIYQYSRDGILYKTWQTDVFGIDAECGLSEKEGVSLLGSPELQLAWVNRRTIIDDIVPLAAGPGLIVRKIEDEKATWQLWILHRRGHVERLPLPFRRPPYQRIRADADGDRLAFLFSNMRREPAPQDIVLTTMPESARKDPALPGPTRPRERR